MGQLPGNDAVKLGSVHPALRRALRTLPSLQPSVLLDVCAVRDGIHTRAERSAQQKRQRHSSSFAAFLAAHPGVLIEAMTVRLVLSLVIPRRMEDVQIDADTVLHWLPRLPS